MALNITWLGHAAFLVEGDGVRLLLDPYRAPDAGDYGPIDVEADVVVASHLNAKYHSHWGAARGHPLCLNALDFADDPVGVTAAGVVIRAVGVWEAADRAVPVAMPYFTLGGLRVCHMGDLGHALSPEEAAPLVGCDVLLAVAGGPPTLSLPDLREAVALIGPRWVIPMHYGTGRVNLPLAPVEEFLAVMGDAPVVRAGSSTVELSGDARPERTTVLVLPPGL